MPNDPYLDAIDKGSVFNNPAAASSGKDPYLSAIDSGTVFNRQTDPVSDLGSAATGAVGGALKSPFTFLGGIGHILTNPAAAGREFAQAESSQFHKGIDQVSKGNLSDFIGGLGSLVSAGTGTAPFGEAADQIQQKSDKSSAAYNPSEAGAQFGDLVGQTELPGLVKTVGGKVGPISSRKGMTAKVVDKLLPSESPEDLVAQGTNSVKNTQAAEQSLNLADAQSAETKARALFEKHQKAVSNAAQRAPTPYYREIQGEADPDSGELPEPTYKKIKEPIEIDNTQAVAKPAFKAVTDALSGAPAGDNPLRKVANNLRALAEEEPAFDHWGNQTKVTVNEFSKLDNLHNSLDNFLNGKATGDSVALDPVIQHLTKLNTAIMKDLDEGLQVWQNGAYEKFVDRNNSYIDLSNKVNARKAQLLLQSGISPEITYGNIAKDALTSPEGVDEFLSKSGGDRPTLTKMAYRKLIEDNMKDGTFDARSAMNDLKPIDERFSSDNNKVYAKAIPSQERTNLAQVFKELSSNRDSTVNAINRKIGITHYGKFYIGAVPISLIAHSAGVPGMVATAGIGAIAGGLKLSGFAIDRLMRNPTMARALIEGAKMPASAPAGMATTKILLNGMRGMGGLTATDNNGNEYDAKVNQNGKIEISQ